MKVASPLISSIKLNRLHVHAAIDLDDLTGNIA